MANGVTGRRQRTRLGPRDWTSPAHRRPHRHLAHRTRRTRRPPWRHAV